MYQKVFFLACKTLAHLPINANVSNPIARDLFNDTELFNDTYDCTFLIKMALRNSFGYRYRRRFEGASCLSCMFNCSMVFIIFPYLTVRSEGELQISTYLE